MKTKTNIVLLRGVTPSGKNKVPMARLSLEQLPLKSLIVRAAVIDIRERASKNPDTELTVEDILSWEKKHGPLPENV